MATRALSTLSLVLVLAALSSVAHAAVTTDAKVVEVASIPQNRHENAVCFLKKLMFVIGGRGNRNIYAYNHKENKWTDYGKVPNFIGDNGQIHHFQCFEWRDGIVIGLTFKENFPKEKVVPQVYHYRPREADVNQRWKLLTTVPAARARGATGAFRRFSLLCWTNGNTLGHGQGIDSSKKWFDCFQANKNKWVQFPDLNFRRDHAGAVYSPFDDAAYVAGGRDGGQKPFSPAVHGIKEIERYSFKTWANDQWEIVASLSVAHPGMTPCRMRRMVVIGDGELQDRTDDVTNMLEIFHVKRKKFVLPGKLPKFTHRHGTGYACCDGTDIVFTSTGAQRPVTGGNIEFGNTEAMFLGGNTNQVCAPNKDFWGFT